MNGLNKLIFLVILTSIAFLPMKGKDIDFSQNFQDSTLRVDLIFAGEPNGIGIFVDSETKQPGWYGRRHNLNKVPLKGNGSILILDPLTKDTLYLNTFSSLFQEWLITPEAGVKPMAFQNSFLLPLPKNEADIKLQLRDNRQKVLKEIKYRFNPNDELNSIRGSNPLSHKYIHRGGNPEDVIDVAIVAEGFTEAQMDSFLYHAERFTNEILSYEPFASNKDKFNFVAVNTPSMESNTSIPLKKVWKNTAFGSHFSTFHSPRYLTVPKLHEVHRSLEGIPYEHILIIVNTPQYGGGGIFNSYQVASSDNEFTLPVTVHEFGHSFAGLADEYCYEDEEDETYPLDLEPWEENITTLVDFSSKWEDMKNPTSDVGLYEGAGYRTKGIYRPTFTCRMRENKFPKFCPVCERTILKVIDFYMN